MNARIVNTGTTRLHAGAMLALAVATAGCTTFGGNVSGDFACRAPGGTCAPMTSIDVGAVAAVLGESATTANSAKSMPLRLANVGRQDAEPTRTGERTLRIVFPAYVDAAGVLHDEATAHAVVEASGWALAPSAPSPASRSGSPALSSSEFSRSPAPS